MFTIVLPPTLGYLLPTIGLAWVLRLLAIIMAGLALAGLLFVPPKGAPVSPKKKALFNFEIWKRKRYVIWALTIPLTLLGYFVPYVHMVRNVFFLILLTNNATTPILVTIGSICLGEVSRAEGIYFGHVHGTYFWTWTNCVWQIGRFAQGG